MMEAEGMGVVGPATPLKRLERQGGMKDHQFNLKWSSGRRSSKDLLSSQELVRKSADFGQQPKKATVKMRGLDPSTRALDSMIGRDSGSLSSRMRGEHLHTDEGGNASVRESFQKEFIEKLAERCKLRPDYTSGDDFVGPQEFVKPVRVHSKHSRQESVDLVKVIGSPKRDSLERVRVIELPKTPRSPLHEKLKAPHVQDKFSDPEWMSKCENLIKDSHCQAMPTGAGVEESKDFILSKFFDDPTVATSPEQVDILSGADIMSAASRADPNKHEVRKMDRRQLPMDDQEEEDNGMPLAGRMFTTSMAAIRGPSVGKVPSVGSRLVAIATRPVNLHTAPTSTGAQSNRKDSAEENSRESARTINEHVMKQIRQKPTPGVKENSSKASLTDFHSDELMRAEEAMLKSLKVAAAVDQAHFLRALQDQGAVQSCSPIRPDAFVEGAEAIVSGPILNMRSPVRSPSHHIVPSAKLKSPKAPYGSSGSNVREVRGNAVEGSGDFLSEPGATPRTPPRISSVDSMTPPEFDAERSVSLSGSTISSRIAARRRRSNGGLEAPITAEIPRVREAFRIEELVLTKAEFLVPKTGNTVSKAGDSPVRSGSSISASSSSTPGPGAESSVSEKNQPTPEKRHRRSTSKDSQVSTSSTRDEHRTPIATAAPDSSLASQASSSSPGADKFSYRGSPDTQQNEGSGGDSILQKLMRRISLRSLAREKAGGEPCHPSRGSHTAPLSPSRANRSRNPGSKSPSPGAVEKLPQRKSPGSVENSTVKPTVDLPPGSQSPDYVRRRSQKVNPTTEQAPRPSSPLETAGTAEDPDPRPKSVRRSGRTVSGGQESPSASAKEEVSLRPSELSRPPGCDSSSGKSGTPVPDPASATKTREEPVNSFLRVSVRDSAGISQPPLPAPDADNSFLRVHLPANAGELQPSPVSSIDLQKSEVFTEGQLTPEGTLSSVPGGWSPGSDDSGSDGSSIEQPSPVSVLFNSRTPFQEEGQLELKTAPLEHKQEELHERSQRSNAAAVVEAKETAEASFIQPVSSEVIVVELKAEVKLPSRRAKPKIKEDISVPANEAIVGPIPLPRRKVEGSDFRKSLEVLTGSVSDFRKSLEIFDLQNIQCSGSRRWDLVYVRDILVASGFGRDVLSGPATKWHSVTEPIDPSLFENMEEYYKCGVEFKGCERLRRLAFYQPDHLELQERIKAAANTRQGRYDPMLRCQLFDSVNELLYMKLSPYRTPPNPWLKPPVMRPRPTGMLLLEEIWRDLCDLDGRNGSMELDKAHLHAQLENLVGEDLYKRSPWIPSVDIDILAERIVVDIAKRIFTDLLFETVATLISI